MRKYTKSIGEWCAKLRERSRAATNPLLRDFLVTIITLADLLSGVVHIFADLDKLLECLHMLYTATFRPCSTFEHILFRGHLDDDNGSSKAIRIRLYARQ